jgi:hypothetical protein
VDHKRQADIPVVKQLAASLGVPESLANLMAQRRITTKEEPGLSSSFSWRPSRSFLMKDMSIAVERISKL